MNIDLTKEEKINFLVKDNYNCIVKMVNDYNKTKKFRKFLTIASAIANGGLIALCITFWNPYSPFLIACALGAFAFPSLAINFHHKLWLNRFIKDCSNNKIGLKEYQKLQKSGELLRWHDEYQDEIIEADTALQKIETEEYKTTKENQKTYNAEKNEIMIKLSLSTNPDPEIDIEEILRVANITNKKNTPKEK